MGCDLLIAVSSPPETSRRPQASCKDAPAFGSGPDNAWTRFFTPWRTLTLCIAALFTIEVAQYFHLYDGTFDPLDFLAYLSILIPVFVLDLILSRDHALAPTHRLPF